MTQRLSTLVAATLTVVLALGACAGGTANREVTVTGTPGAPPVVQIDAPLSLNSTQVTALYGGEGRTLAEGDPVLLRMYSYDGHTGEARTGQGSDAPALVRLSAEDLGSDLAAAMVGEAEGARLLVTQPVSGEAGAADAADQMLVVVVDILPTRATGEPRDLPGDLGITVSERPGGAPEISMAEAEPPQELRVEVAREGSGESVLPGQYVTVQYHSVVWGTGDVFQSTWDAGQGPQVAPVDDLLPGLRNALTDHDVGSRLVVLVPAAQAFGDNPLAFVVDILAVSGSQPADLVTAS